MKKDILFLCQFFHPEHNSSATLPFDTAKYLAEHGFVVDALCGYPKEYSDQDNIPLRETVDGVGIQRIRYIQMARGKRLSRLINYFSFTAIAFFHLCTIRKYKSIIVYSNPPVLSFVAVLANIMFKTKIVFVAYDVYPEVAFASGSLRQGSVIDRGMRWINHLMYKRASNVVALTDEMREFLIKNRPEIEPEKIVTIANWAHEKERKVEECAYERFGYTEDQFIVSYFGNMGTCQDMDTLMSAAEQLRDELRIQFLIVGHGNKKERVQQMINDKSLQNVQLLDFLIGDEFEQAVSIGSCSVVSLEKGLMGMCAPSKYYSYLQGGQPILAVVEEGSYLAKEVEREHIGKSIPIGDKLGLAKAILEMSKCMDETIAMGERAQALYKKLYTMDKGLQKYAEIMEHMI